MKTVTTLAELNDLAGAGQLLGLVDVPMELYHAGPGVSSSGLKEILKSPAHYQAYKAEPQTDTAALRFGRLVHTRLLEPELFKTTVVVRREKPQEPARPEHLAAVTRRSKEGKAALDEWEASWRPDYLAAVAAWEKETEGKEAISPAEAETLEAIAEAASRNKLASTIFGKGDAEVSCYWIDEETGVLCKARADFMRDGVIFDVKTCFDGSPKGFQAAVQKYQYHLSAAFYSDGFQTVTPVKNFAWVAVEKNPPYCFAFYAADQETLNTGRADYRRALATYAECERSGTWPGYEQAFLNVSLAGA